MLNDTRNTNFNTTPGILILSHGPFCISLIETARLIVGDMENVIALPLDSNCSIEDYTEKVKTILGSMPEGSLILLDLFGGSPFNIISRLGNNSFNAICGMNLPMLLEALNLRNFLSGKELLKAVEDAGHSGISNVNDFIESLANT